MAGSGTFLDLDFTAAPRTGFARKAGASTFGGAAQGGTPLFRRPDGYVDPSNDPPLAILAGRHQPGPQWLNPPNSNFEDGLNGWTGSATGTGTAPVVDATAANKRTGVNAVKMVTAAAADTSVLVGPLFPAGYGIPLSLYAMAKSSGSKGRVTLSVAYFQNDGKTANGSPVTVRQVTGILPSYQLMGDTVTPPANTAYAQVTVTLDTAADTIWIDEQPHQRATAFDGPVIPTTPANTAPSGYNPNVFVPRLAKDNADDFVSFKRFRMAADSDDGVTINRALSLHPAIFVPAGDYLSAAAITLSQNGSRLHGAGRHNTRIRSTSATADLIVIGEYTTGLSVEKLSLGRTVKATDGAGIASRVSTSYCCIRDIYAENHYNGLLLSNTDFSFLQDIIAQSNYNCGIYMLPSVAGTLQWSMLNILSQSNDSAGISVNGSTSVSSVTMGDFVKVSTYGNGGCGMVFQGVQGCPINGIRVNGAFVGQDGNDEILLDDYGGIDNTFINVIAELGGTGATGRTGQFSASGLAHGFHGGPHNTECSIANMKSSGHSRQGILLEGGGTTIINGAQCYDNGSAATANAIGVHLTAGRLIGTNIVSGSRNGAQIQQYGLQAYDGNYCLITGGGLIGNKTKPYNFAANASAGAANLVNVLQG